VYRLASNVDSWRRFQGLRRWAQAAVVLVLVGIVAGCASGGTKQTPTAATITAAAGAIVDWNGNNSAAPLTGFGATTAAWNGAHTAVSGFTPGAVYDDDPALPKVNGNEGAHYAAVLHENGHVFNYDYRFTNRPIAAAKATVLRTEFPSDAKVAWFVVKRTCAFMLVKSKKVGKALGSKAIGDAPGTALVEFSSGLIDYSYNPHAVNDALLQVYSLVPKRQAPGC
jgi:hypothetical protein